MNKQQREYLIGRINSETNKKIEKLKECFPKEIKLTWKDKAEYLNKNKSKISLFAVAYGIQIKYEDVIEKYSNEINKKRLKSIKDMQPKINEILKEAQTTKDKVMLCDNKESFRLLTEYIG